MHACVVESSCQNIPRTRDTGLKRAPWPRLLSVEVTLRYTRGHVVYAVLGELLYDNTQRTRVARFNVRLPLQA